MKLRKWFGSLLWRQAFLMFLVVTSTAFAQGYDGGGWRDNDAYCTPQTTCESCNYDQRRCHVMDCRGRIGDSYWEACYIPVRIPVPEPLPPPPPPPCDDVSRCGSCDPSAGIYYCASFNCHGSIYSSTLIAYSCVEGDPAILLQRNFCIRNPQHRSCRIDSACTTAPVSFCGPCNERGVKSCLQLSCHDQIVGANESACNDIPTSVFTRECGACSKNGEHVCVIKDKRGKIVDSKFETCK